MALKTSLYSSNVSIYGWLNGWPRDQLTHIMAVLPESMNI